MRETSVIDKEDPLRLELQKSIDHFKERYSNIERHKHCYKLLNFTEAQDVELINWLLAPIDTRLQFENLGNLLKIPSGDHKYLHVLIYNILWALPSPLSPQLHKLYSPRVHPRF